MDAVTAPRKLARKDDLVVISKREYAEFSRWKKRLKGVSGEGWFWTPEWQKKEREANEDIRAGRVIGPFSSHNKFLAALKVKEK